MLLFYSAKDKLINSEKNCLTKPKNQHEYTFYDFIIDNSHSITT